TGGDAAPLVGPERCRPVRMGFRCLQALDQSDRPELRPVGSPRSFLGGILEPEVDRVHADRFGKLIYDALDGKLGNWSARGTVSSDLRAVRHHVVAHG